MATVASHAPAHRSGWTITEGVVLIIVGLAAVASPLLTAEVTALALPWVLLIEGIMLLVAAFSGTTVGSRGWTIAFAILAILTSFAVFARPVATFLSLPIIMAVYLIAKGIGQFVVGASMTEGKGWIFTAAVLNIVFGLLVWAAPFGSALLFTGLYIGISILAFGVVLLMLPAAPDVSPGTDTAMPA